MRRAPSLCEANMALIEALAEVISMTPRPPKALGEAFIWEGAFDTRPLISWDMIDQILAVHALNQSAGETSQ